jgi:hypothetical protein
VEDLKDVTPEKVKDLTFCINWMILEAMCQNSIEGNQTFSVYRSENITFCQRVFESEISSTVLHKDTGGS